MTFPTRAISHAEQQQYWQTLKSDQKISASTADYLQHHPYFVVHDGDLVIDGDFAPADDISLLVMGNLTITGSYDDQYGRGHVVVVGDMTTKNMLSGGFRLSPGV